MSVTNNPVPDEAISPALRVNFWGVRGSIPAPGKNTVRYGGNTACVEVSTGAPGEYVVLDGGTGLRPFGDHLSALDWPGTVDLFLTHVHWDHIQGIPFFKPLYDGRMTVRIHGPAHEGIGIKDLVMGQSDGIYFPVRFSDYSARTLFIDVGQGITWTRARLKIDSFPANHTHNTVGYRLRSADRTLVYFPDNSLNPLDAQRNNGWYDALVEYIRGADLLIHDAVYTDEEYVFRAGWGHSSHEQVLHLAETAGVRSLCLFHHDPDRSDDALDHIVERLQGIVQHSGFPLEIMAAQEGGSILL